MGNKFKISKKLDPYIKEYYKYEIGTPDMSQNWLELFHGTIINDLFTIMHSNSDNQLKSDYVEELLGPFGFTSKGGGLGTNILVLTHPYYPGVVFKIALDENGIADNFNDCLLQDMVPHYARVFARHPSGLVTVQERYFVMKPEWMPLYRNDILYTLRKLSEDFLIADLTPSMILNYGIDRKGKFVFIDGSDLYPLKQIKAKDRLRCVAVTGSDKNGELKRCRGKCKYNEDFSQMICEKCGRTYIPIELRPRKEEYSMKNIFSDGFTLDDREELERRTRVAIERHQPLEKYIPEHIKNNNEEDEEDMRELPEGYHIQIWRQGTDRIKIAVQDGFRVVALDKNGEPVVRPDKKGKQIKHEDSVVRVPSEETYRHETKTDDVPKIKQEPSNDYKQNLLTLKEKYPEDFRTYVGNLIDVVGWEIIDSFREADEDDESDSMGVELLITDNNILKHELAESQASYGKLKEHLARKDSTIEELSEKVKTAEAANKQLQSNIVNLNFSLTEKDTVTDHLHQELERLQHELNTALEANDGLSKMIDTLREEVIKNETSNNIIQKMQSDENPNCIHYQVVEATDQESGATDLPGIYFHVRGDIVDAYDNYGLPIFVCVEGYNVSALAINTLTLREFIFDAFDDVIEDSNGDPVIVSTEDVEEPAPNANYDMSDASHIEELKSLTTILDEDEKDDDDGEEMSDEEEEELLTRIAHNSNPNYDPRYETARDWADRI